MNVSLLTRVFVFIGCLLPCVYLFAGALSNQFGPDPIDKLIEWTGLTAMCLMFSVLLLPIVNTKKSIRRLGLLSYRRMVGLFVFFYASLHLLLVFVYIFGFSWQILIAELSGKPFIWLGMLAWVLLLPLALTSTSSWRKRLKANWRRLHILVYPAMVAVAIHYGLQLRGEIIQLFWLLPISVFLVFRRAKHFIG